MITSTAAAKPVPCAIENRRVLRLRAAPAGALRARRAKASGTTIRLSEGAATIPTATHDWPLSRLTATRTAKRVRKQDSERISAVKRPKRFWPARKPRAK